MKCETKVFVSVVYASILAIFALVLGILEILSFLGLQVVGVPRDIMGGFSLIVASTLILYGARDTVRMLYNGLSFYLVGITLLLGIGFLHISIVLADILDYYILCIGENCTPYSCSPRPEIYIFFLTLLALYPFFARRHFRRKTP